MVGCGVARYGYDGLGCKSGGTIGRKGLLFLGCYFMGVRGSEFHIVRWFLVLVVK